MSSTQDIIDVVERAAEDYSDNNASNTVLCLQDIDWEVQPYCLMTRTCYVEYDPMSSRAKLPSCFTRDLGPFLRNYVILQDQERNRIQVSIERKNAKIYFGHGWSRLKDFYHISMGAWVTILYINPLLFRIKIRKITGIEVTYPKKNPPFRLMLPEPSPQSSSKGPVPYFVAPRTFCHKLKKTLTSIDVESGILKLCSGGFCELALPNEQAELTLIDWLGCKWRCQLGFGYHPHKTYQISGEWLNICKVHRLVEGVTLELCVTDASNNRVVHFKISPFIGVRTTLIAPTTNATYKAFYQAQRYFIL